MAWWDFIPCQGCGNCGACRSHYDSSSTSWGKRGTKKYKARQKAYNREYAKRPKSKASRTAWRRTKAGRIYRLRAAMSRVKRHKAWIDGYKLAKGCENCGFNKWPECLDFDHKIASTKAF